MVDQSVYGTPRYGYFRYGVYDTRWEPLSTKVSDGGIGVEVTRRKLTLSTDRHATTGWRTKSWTESTIVGVMQHKGSTPTNVPAGIYVRYDLVFYTLDAIVDGEQVKYRGKWHEVKSVEDHYDATGGFAYRTCQLRKLPMED